MTLRLSAISIGIVLTTGWAATAAAHTDPSHAHATPPHTAQAAAPHTPAAIKLDAHTREDMERHRSMARAHEQAAQCLAEGRKPDDCQKQLQTSCKGLALGKSCGLRHAH